MLAELCFNRLIGGPVNFHFAGEGLLVLSLAYCRLSSDVPEQISGPVLSPLTGSSPHAG